MADKIEEMSESEMEAYISRRLEDALVAYLEIEVAALEGLVINGRPGGAVPRGILDMREIDDAR